MSSRAPIIGFSLDYEETGSYATVPWYAIRENYLKAVSDLGAIPLPLPHETSFVSQYLDMIDGLIVTGGGFDIPPEFYGESTVHETVTMKQGRTDFEFAIAKGALAANKPLLGICGGEQLLNVILGGTLIQHIPDSISNALEHKQKPPYNKPAHTVKVMPSTLLHKIIGQDEIPVNTSHHQAVAKAGKGVVINAVAPDGVIEGIEYPAHPFCLGVEWHPEYLVSPADRKIFAAFVEFCR